MTAYAELQVTSNFSFLRGASHADELVTAAAEATTTDQSLSIAKAVISTVTALATRDFGPSIMAELPKRPVCPTYTATKIFDPFVDNEWKPINAFIAANGGNLELHSEYDTGVNREVPTCFETDKLKQCIEKVAPGLLYRQKGPAVIVIGERVGSKFVAKTTEYVMLPQGGPVSLLPIQGGPFVTTKFEYDFENGQPTRLKVDRPSELLALAQFPLEVAKAIISTPTDLLKLKVDYSTQQKTLLEAQKAIIETQQGIIEAQENLDAAENP